MTHLTQFLLSFIALSARTRMSVQLEVAVRRHQLSVYRTERRKPPRIRSIEGPSRWAQQLGTRAFGASNPGYGPGASTVRRQRTWLSRSRFFVQMNSASLKIAA